MQDLITIQIRKLGVEKQQTVKAKDLFNGLQIQKRFTDWIKHQIASLDFEEGLDYIVLDEKVKHESGTKSEKNYLLSLDTAKHIAMASRTKKGKEVRKYFIDVEKAYQDKQFEKITREAVSQFSDTRINKLISIDQKQEITAVAVFLNSRRFCELGDTFIEILKVVEQESNNQVYQAFLKTLDEKLQALKSLNVNIAEIAEEFDDNVTFFSKYNGTENQISQNAKEFIQNFKSMQM